ncbi:MAG: DNA-methyltransferase, partial [Sphaerospermopsis kisseleviana]
RKIKFVNLKVVNLKENKELVDNIDIIKNYKTMSFFKRFLVSKEKISTKTPENLSPFTQLDLYQGDAFEIICHLNSNSLGGAVTSPPYYNARDYANWDNIYCYLYDMYNIAKELYRCLKPGSPCLFNIFDYFDNENIIVFSDMGKKRLILSSYMSFIFRYIGFEHIGNIAWDKGEIEGNRNFNQGNYSPYYQAPLNCWEHILIFSKGKPQFNVFKLPKVIRETPVIKIIKGKNVYGHTAPFPVAIPNLLFSLISPEETIIDPFTGSMTTGRAAMKNKRKSINIELHKEYCDLALDLLKKQMNEVQQMCLFD